jgi:hypothetical protein
MVTPRSGRPRPSYGRVSGVARLRRREPCDRQPGSRNGQRGDALAVRTYSQNSQKGDLARIPAIHLERLQGRRQSRPEFCEYCEFWDGLRSSGSGAGRKRPPRSAGRSVRRRHRPPGRRTRMPGAGSAAISARRQLDDGIRSGAHPDGDRPHLDLRTPSQNLQNSQKWAGRHGPRRVSRAGRRPHPGPEGILRIMRILRAWYHTHPARAVGQVTRILRILRAHQQ